MGVRVRRPGVLSTVQDLGRPGHRHEGVPLGGAADAVALRVANLLVGNDEGAAAIEATLVGPELEFTRDSVVAVGGGEFAEVPSWRPWRVRAGEVVRLGGLVRGCRACIAIAGGIAVPPVMGSRSTCLRAGFGGWWGRALEEGDELPLGQPRGGEPDERWFVSEEARPAYSARPQVRVVAGAQAGEFPAEWLERTFFVSPQSDRMGVRLSGAAMARSSREELVSAPVTPGTVQVPPDGNPIVLLADAQTIGGYPRLAHVIEVDLPLMAQLRPGDAVRFALVTLAEAHRLWREREATLGLLRVGIAGKFR